MFFGILKRDLKRKKVMNIVLFLFIFLSSMFVTSSVNNISTITSSLDNYFDEAGVPDYFMATLDKSNIESVEIFLDSIEEIDSYGVENVLFGSKDNFFINNIPIETTNTCVIMDFQDREINYYNADNEIIKSIEKGKVLVSPKLLMNDNLTIGDKITCTFGNKSTELEIAGIYKDAVLGSDSMGMCRFMVNEEDFKLLKESDLYGAFSGGLWYIKTNNVKAVEKTIDNFDINTIFSCNRNVIKTSYTMNMIIAGVILIVSVCLIVIALVMLKFTISFTLNEEYREIGVMKAIGIKNVNIRYLYLIKYFSLAVCGSIIGLIMSVPFGNMLIKSVSETIVMRNENLVIINIICSMLLIAIIMSFSYSCTRKINEYSPVDAIRSGTTGERFTKKSVLRLSKHKSKPSGFMALNDVLSSPKRYAIVTLIYSLCLSLILILVNTVNTLKSGNLVTTFAITESDVYYKNDSKQMSFVVDGGKTLVLEYMDSIEKTLEDHNMPAESVCEFRFNFSLTYKDNSFKSTILQGVNTTTEMYQYYEGSAPQNVNEIAITPLVAEKLGATIGDTVIIQLPTGEQEFIVTALFQSMMNMGNGVRVHEDLEINYIYVSGINPVQINFTDECNEKEIQNRITQMKGIFTEGEIYTADECVELTIGVAPVLDKVKTLTLIVSIMVIILVTVLMELSFITKEKSEIATLKAIGFKNSSIIMWHTLRFILITVIASAIAIALSYPLTYVAITPIFRMMGAYYGIKYDIKLLEILLIYPLIMLSASILSAFATSLYTNKIKTSDTTIVE